MAAATFYRPHEADMLQGSGRYQTWLRVAFVIIASGLLYLGLQFTDLFFLQSFAAAAGPVTNTVTPAGVSKGVTVQPVAYVPVGEKAPADAFAGDDAASEARLAEVGEGGDLARRARTMLEPYRPYVLGQERGGVVYVSLAAVVKHLGGELDWSPGQTRAAVLLPDAMVSLVPGQAQAERNYRPFALPAPVLEQYGQLRVPVKSLEMLCDARLKGSAEGNFFTLTPRSGEDGNHPLHVIVRERMYSLEATRAACSLQVFFLGQPIKQYPLCMGEGDNTPCGHWQIVNKAQWPPWTAYWGEYMPGHSPKNPLGARWLGTSAHGRETGRVIGIHGTNQPSSIGRRISGGCMRTYNNLAIELYDNIPVGTQLWIHE